MDRNSNMIEKDYLTELVLYDNVGEEAHFLNETARFVYKLYQAGQSPEEIEVALRKEFHVDETQAVRQDIHNLIQLFREKKLVEK